MPTDNQQDSAVLVWSRADHDGELVRSLLEKVGLSVRQAANTDEALELFSSDLGSIRLLVVDESGLPAVTPAFFQCVRSLKPGIRIMVLSDRDQAELARDYDFGPQAGAVLKRPFRRAKFIGLVLELMDESLARTA